MPDVATGDRASTKRATSFGPHGQACAATHYSPEGAAPESAGRACVVMAHGFAATMSCGLDAFAETFCGAGFDVLAFDYRHFGTSDGEPRQHVSPRRQVEDYRRAVAHARSLRGVDPSRVVLWGASLSGGHVLAVAAGDHRVAAVIALTPAPDGLVSAASALRSQGARSAAGLGLACVRDLAAAARRRPAITVPVVAHAPCVATMTHPDAVDGYLRIAGPDWKNDVQVRGLLASSVYRPSRLAKAVSCPVLVQVADDDLIAPPHTAMKAAWDARAEVRHYPCDHFDVYPGADWFDAVATHQLAFIERALAGSTQGRGPR